MRIKELGHVVLYVSDLKRSADFYRDTLGFREIARDTQTALFSSGRTHHELLLIEIGLPRQSDSKAGGEVGSPQRVPKTGLYHIGFKIGDTPGDIQDAYNELLTKGVTIIGSSDHSVTHSLYILDPDGNELELYADVSDEWKTNPKAVLKPARYLPLEKS